MQVQGKWTLELYTEFFSSGKRGFDLHLWLSSSSHIDSGMVIASGTLGKYWDCPLLPRQASVEQPIG